LRGHLGPAKVAATARLAHLEVGMNKKIVVTALALGLAGLVQAQELSVSVGAKAWSTQWTTFGYDTNNANQTVLIQVAARDKTVLIPLLSARYGDFVGSISGYRPTDYSFVDGSGGNTRKELDANVGYFVMPGLALTLGYKKVGQKAGSDNYELGGLVAGLSATAPLGPSIGLYGSFGLGRMKDTAASTVKFDADYRLSEVGLAYSLPMDGRPKALSFTLGYRTQVLSSKEALGAQDGRDLTQGFTFGLVATF
jgi:hypothetical protein